MIDRIEQLFRDFGPRNCCATEPGDPHLTTCKYYEAASVETETEIEQLLSEASPWGRRIGAIEMQSRMLILGEMTIACQDITLRYQSPDAFQITSIVIGYSPEPDRFEAKLTLHHQHNEIFSTYLFTADERLVLPFNPPRMLGPHELLAFQFFNWTQDNQAPIRVRIVAQGIVCHVF